MVTAGTPVICDNALNVVGITTSTRVVRVRRWAWSLLGCCALRGARVAGPVYSTGAGVALRLDIFDTRDGLGLCVLFLKHTCIICDASYQCCLLIGCAFCFDPRRKWRDTAQCYAKLYLVVRG